MILKSYIRIFTNDIENTLRVLRALDGSEVDLRFSMQQMGVEVAAMGDFCIVAGSDQALAPIRSSLGPIVVDDLAATEQTLLGVGATITLERSKGHTGVFLYAKHPDGSVVEYVEWDEETKEKMLNRHTRR